MRLTSIFTNCVKIPRETPFECTLSFTAAVLSTLIILIFGILQDPRTNEYLIVEPETKLLTLVRPEEFRRMEQKVLVWFTACDNFDNVILTECMNCEICLAGIENTRFYYDEIFQVIMYLPRDRKTQRHFRIDMNMVTESGSIDHHPVTRLHCPKGNIVNEARHLKLAVGNANSTAFKIE